ncbi:MAG: GNAT family N-acetyltransferase [Sphingomonas sp.]|jgi:ribosomal-protein-alanine N-acetyltransferase
MTLAVNPIDIRQGATGDIGIVDDIMQQAFDPRFGEAWTRGQCLAILAIPSISLTLASIDGVTSGFALIRSAADEAELLLLATLPAMRRRGVARALLRAVISDSKQRSISKLFLEVRRGNEAASLYRAIGFAKVGERRGYYRGSDNQLYDALTYCYDIEQ